MCAVHGQACWRCGDAASLDVARIAPILTVDVAVARGTVIAELMGSLGLERESKLDGPRNWSLCCASCAPSPDVSLADLRVWLDRAARRAATVRRVALEATYAPALSEALAAVGSAMAETLDATHVAALATGWATYQSKKKAFVRAGADPYDFKQDSFAKTAIVHIAPAALRITAALSLGFDPQHVPSLSDLRWGLSGSAS